MTCLDPNAAGKRRSEDVEILWKKQKPTYKTYKNPEKLQSNPKKAKQETRGCHKEETGVDKTDCRAITHHELLKYWEVECWK